MRLFHDSIELLWAMPFGPRFRASHRAEFHRRGPLGFNRYREFGDWPHVPVELRQTKKNPSTDTWGDKAGSRGVGHAKQFGDALTQRPLGGGR